MSLTAAGRLKTSQRCLLSSHLYLDRTWVKTWVLYRKKNYSGDISAHRSELRTSDVKPLNAPKEEFNKEVGGNKRGHKRQS